MDMTDWMVGSDFEARVISLTKRGRRIVTPSLEYVKHL